jgi:cyclopropane-fatty-acyl-phospholipid synthase
MEVFVRYVMPYLPDWVVRWLLRRVLHYSARQLASRDWPQKELRFADCTRQMENIAVDTAAANQQHYEVPTAFFTPFLGNRMKYSSCEWEGSRDTLNAAEDRTLDRYLSHMDIEAGDVRRVLDMGCGWGSFSLYAAKKYPQIQFVCFSNSSTQIAFIKSQALELGITNLKPVKLDINNLSMDALQESEPFDRVVAIESLEHSKNYEEIFQRVTRLLTPSGMCFFQLLCHREYSYPMQDDSWMGRNFFTGGVIPSTKLFYLFTKNLVVEKQWVIKGTHYKYTLDAWLERMYKVKSQLMKALTDDGCKDPIYEFEKWRMFHLMCAESFGLNRGQEWMVTYLLMKPRRAPE